MSYPVRAPRIIRPVAPIPAPVILSRVPEIAPDNRRWAHRRVCSSSATLQAPELGELVPCVVLDTSSTGARIKPHFTRAARNQSILDLPETFTLVYAIDRVAIDCRIAWRRGSELGLKFVSPARTLPKPTPPKLKVARR